MNSASLIESHV